VYVIFNIKIPKIHFSLLVTQNRTADREHRQLNGGDPKHSSIVRLLLR
jgi:hypothetical protein